MNAVLRNTTFTKSLFYKLKFNLQPEPYRISSEGYLRQYGPISIQTGEYNINLKTNFSYYDEKLHQTYKKYYSNQSFNSVDVFKTYWGNYEIYCVEFNQSVIQSSQMNDYFHKVIFSNCTIEDVRFSTNFTKSKFINTVFNKCHFAICLFDHHVFENVTFTDCVINHSNMKMCDLSVKFVNCQFNNSSFNYCNIDHLIFNGCKDINVYQHGCHYNKKQSDDILTYQHHITNEEFNELLNNE